MPDDQNDFYKELYTELHQIADRHMKSEREDHTLQPTALINEAFLRLAKRDPSFADRKHFLALASIAMRQILIEWARRRRTQKRGGGAHRVQLDSFFAPTGEVSLERTIEIDDAMKELSEVGRNGKRQAELIGYICFGGMSIIDAAKEVGVSRETATRDWRFGKAWMTRRLSL